MIAMYLKWNGITPALYNQLHDIVKWEENHPTGGLFHVAYFDNEGVRVQDVWETAEDFNNFTNDRLMPGGAKLGITSQPTIEIFPVHAVFTPGYVSKKELETA